LMMHTFRWANVKDPSLYLDENTLRMCTTHRYMMASLAQALYNEGQYQKAEKVIDVCMRELPVKTIPVHFSLVDMAKVLYAMDKKEKARKIIKTVADNSVEYLNWTYNLKPSQYVSASMLVNTQLYTLQEVLSVLSQYDKELLKVYLPIFQKNGQYFQQSMAMRNSRNR